MGYEGIQVLLREEEVLVGKEEKLTTIRSHVILEN